MPLPRARFISAHPFLLPGAPAIMITRVLIFSALTMISCDDQKEADEPVVDPERGREILEAIKAGKTDHVTRMIERERNLLYAKDEFGWRPLHLAVRYRRTELVSFLIRKGANVNQQDGDGQTALMWAIEYERPDYVESLLMVGADPNIREVSQDWGPLHKACFYSLPKVVKMLLDKGADVNHVDETGRSPLLWALTPISHDNRLEVLPLLLMRGADVDVENKEGLTPIQIVEGRGGETAGTLVAMLRKYGAVTE